MSLPAQHFAARPRLSRSGNARSLAAGLALCAACASGRPLPDARFEELHQQLSAQSELIARQQQRIEQLEVRVATLASRGAPAAPAAATAPAATASQPAAAPAQVPAPASSSSGGLVPRSLQTVKLQAPSGGRRPRSPRTNPVERAPRLPTQVEFKEPDEVALAELDEPSRASVDSALREVADADHAFAQAVQLLNDGNHADAQRELIAFAVAHPHHTAADNALYLAGLSRAASGDCAGALMLFDRVPLAYPAGDAVAPALLEKGRCLARLKRPDAATALSKVTQEFPDSAEAVQARQLIDGLEARR